MARIFKELQDFVSYHNLETTYKYDVSATIGSKKLWEMVVVGGKVTRVGEDLFHKGNYYIELDDDVATVGVYAIAPIVNDYPQLIQLGSVVLVKGTIIDKVVEGTVVKLRYVAARAVEVVRVEVKSQ